MTSAQYLGKSHQGRLDKTGEQLLQYIVGGAEQMQQLIEALLAYAREVERSSKFRKGAVDLSSVAETVLANLLEVETTGAHIEILRAARCGRGFCPAFSVFQNLVGNALKYRGKQPPQITIAAQEGSDQWVFSVRDNGIGIQSGQHQRIFAPLYRLHGPELAGTGIGLAIL